MNIVKLESVGVCFVLDILKKVSCQFFKFYSKNNAFDLRIGLRVKLCVQSVTFCCCFFFASFSQEFLPQLEDPGGSKGMNIRL